MGRLYSGDVRGYYFTNDKGLKSACMHTPRSGYEIIEGRTYSENRITIAQNLGTIHPDLGIDGTTGMDAPPKDTSDVVAPICRVPTVNVPARKSFERSPEYLNAIDYRAFITKINGRYNSWAGAYESAPPISEPFAVCGAPTQKQIDTNECRRYLKMRWSEDGFTGLNELQKEILLQRKNVESLLARPQSLAALLSVAKLFIWDPHGSGNFTVKLGATLSNHGFR